MAAQGVEVRNIIRRYYTPYEVSMHNSESNCWISWLGKVYDLTPLIKKYQQDETVGPIVKAAGTDISSWFDADTGDVKTCIHPITKLVVPFTPDGRFVHIPPPEPRSDWKNDFGTPWWRNQEYCIGNLTKRTRNIRVINTLTHQEHIIEVCSEETIDEIKSRYRDFNVEIDNYIWKRHGTELEMFKTLDELGIPDPTEEYKDLDIEEDYYYPALHIYFIDEEPKKL